MFLHMSCHRYIVDISTYQDHLSFRGFTEPTNPRYSWHTDPKQSFTSYKQMLVSGFYLLP